MYATRKKLMMPFPSNYLQRCLCLFMIVLCYLRVGQACPRQGVWDELSVNYKPKEYLTWQDGHKDPMPLRADLAEKSGWTMIDDACEAPDGPWRGRRYALNSDHALILLYDVNGNIAGVQSSVSVNGITGFPSWKQRPPFISDSVTGKYTVTAYFVDPRSICDPTRARPRLTVDEMKSSKGFGDGLRIQRTSHPEESALIPHSEANLQAFDNNWTKGKCFFGMGQHYWYDLHADTMCDEFLPVFLLYHKGLLEGFGWAFLADYSSPRFEHPNYEVAKYFMEERPTCMANAGRLSTQHIFFHSNSNLVLPRQTCAKDTFRTLMARLG